MRGIKYIFLVAAVFMMFGAAPKSQQASAQISVGIGIGGYGIEPSCPYGYYGYAPYRCAPYGYYGPEWFGGGRFIGAGRWSRGGPGFYGHVNRSYDPRYGYHGGYPGHGAYREGPDHFQNFHGSHYSDPGGHYHTEQQHGSYVHGGGGHDGHR
jgi:hypothetical protein